MFRMLFGGTLVGLALGTYIYLTLPPDESPSLPPDASSLEDACFPKDPTTGDDTDLWPGKVS